MLELRGKYNIAKVFTDEIDQSAISQIINLLNQEFIQGSQIRMMPDVHAGAGCTIGTTMTITDKIVPNLEGSDFDDYIHDMKIVQKFASVNRHAIAEILVDIMKWRPIEIIHTIHNYIDTENMILRKGAVSAEEGERLVIPMNMRDGSLICVGNGNPDWNCSAPHGAGRLMSRSEAKSKISMEDFEDSMKGINTTSVNQSTLDECPTAYKSMDSIVENIGETVEIVDIIKPVYNFKASGD